MLLVAGCTPQPDSKNPPSPDRAPPVVAVVAVQVSPSNPSIAKGTQQQLTATAVFSDGSMQNVSQAVAWSATDVAPAVGVATVSTTGLVTGQSPGRTLLSAAFQGQVGSTELTVTAAALTALAVSPQNPSIADGTTQQFTATGTFSDGSTQDVSGMVVWKATDVALAVNVALISSTGLVTGKNLGTTTIGVTLLGKANTTQLTVTAAVPVALAVSPSTPSVAKGTMHQFTAKATFSDGSTQDVTTMALWSATDVAPALDVAAMTSGGLLTANNLGQTVVNAQAAISAKGTRPG